MIGKKGLFGAQNGYYHKGNMTSENRLIGHRHGRFHHMLQPQLPPPAEEKVKYNPLLKK
jgi:hypothetical protein